MRVHHTAAVALSAVLLLTSCNGGGDDPPEAPSSTPSDTTSAAASQSVAPTEPTLPDAATRPTEAGARAFITYYWDLINYAQATGKVKTLREASAATCAVCVGITRDVRKHYAAGGMIHGGENDVAIREVRRLRNDNNTARAFRIDMVVSHADQQVVSSDGTTDDREAGSSRFTAYVLWVEDARWRLDALDLR